MTFVLVVMAQVCLAEFILDEHGEGAAFRAGAAWLEASQTSNAGSSNRITCLTAPCRDRAEAPTRSPHTDQALRRPLRHAFRRSNADAVPQLTVSSVARGERPSRPTVLLGIDHGAMLLQLGRVDGSPLTRSGEAVPSTI